MQHRPSAQLTLILGFIFICASLFFAITHTVAKDIATAQSLKRAQRTVDTTSAPKSPSSGVRDISPDPKQTGLKKIPTSLDPTLQTYLEVTDSCGVHFAGECLRVRSGPGTNFPVVASLRNGMVLKVAETITTGTTTWHKIVFDEWLRYPKRHKGDWYVAGDFVTLISDPGLQTRATHPSVGTSTKSILVDRSDQKLYAYDGDVLFMTATTSTGLDSTPTPRGVFSIYQKTPSRYMQGPLPNINSDQYYDLPGVPWNLYFTAGGAVIHGAYWHDSFGTKYSHGCVNLEPAVARTVYNWADIGTTVTVRD